MPTAGARLDAATRGLSVAADHGATVLNYAEVTGLVKDADGYLSAVEIEDRESGRRYTAEARVIVNATGIFTEEIRRMAEGGATRAMVAPSQALAPGWFSRPAQRPG